MTVCNVKGVMNPQRMIINYMVPLSPTERFLANFSSLFLFYSTKLQNSVINEQQVVFSLKKKKALLNHYMLPAQSQTVERQS